MMPGQAKFDSEEEIEMNNGCICCTVRGDLVRILTRLMKRKAHWMESSSYAFVGRPLAGIASHVPCLSACSVVLSTCRVACRSRCARTEWFIHRTRSCRRKPLEWPIQLLLLRPSWTCAPRLGPQPEFGL